MRAQEFRRAEHEIFGELGEPLAHVARLGLAVRGKRPALARVVTAFRMPQHENNALVRLDSFIDILDVGKDGRRRSQDKVRILFQCGRSPPGTLLVCIIVVPGEAAHAHIAFLAGAKAVQILEAVGHEEDFASAVAGKAFLDLRIVRNVRHRIAAMGVRHLENLVRIASLAGFDAQFLLVERLQVLLETGVRTVCCRKLTAQARIAIHGIGQDHQIRNGGGHRGTFPAAARPNIIRNRIQEGSTLVQQGFVNHHMQGEHRTSGILRTNGSIHVE